MRMWGVKPPLLCDQHLLGEHVEMHMFLGTLRKGISVEGYVSTGLVEVHNIRARHERLAEELLARGMNHRSPAQKATLFEAGQVDRAANLVELARRCTACAGRQQTEVL